MTPESGQAWVPFRRLLRPDNTAVCRTKWLVREIVSGVSFGIAFQIKLVNVILLPLAALIVWLLHRATALQRSAGVPPAARSGRDGWITLFRSLLFLAAGLAITIVAVDRFCVVGATGVAVDMGITDWQRCGSPLPRFPSTRCRTRGREPSRYRRAIVDRATEPAGPAGPDCCPPRCTVG